MKELTGHYAVVDNTRIYYEECGEGVPLFCIHTAGACSMEYMRFLPIMADNGFRAIAVDLPGHGKSLPVKWEPFRVMHEYAEFVWKVMLQICHGEKPVVLGCSIGGNMSLDLACHHSEDIRAAIVLEGAAYTPTVGNLFEVEEPHAFPSWQKMTERGACASCFQPISPEVEAELIWYHRYAPQQIAAADLQCWINHDVRDKLGYIKCPVLILKGEADYFVPEKLVDATVAGIPEGLAVKVIGKQMGHYAVVERPEDVAGIVVNFLKSKKQPE